MKNDYLNSDNQSKEDLILKEQLIDYYQNNYGPSQPIESIHKTRLMTKIHKHQRDTNFRNLLLGAVSVALLLITAVYIVSSFDIESKIERGIEFID